MAITKYLPSKPFSSGTEYEVFKYNYCNRCKKHKEREDGFPAFPEDGGCPIEDAMEFARFDRERFPGDKIRKLIDSDGDVAKWHHCMEFETWQVNKMTAQEAIKRLQYERPAREYHSNLNEVFDMAIEALEKQIPKKILYRKQNYGTPWLCCECEADQTPTEFFSTDGSEPKEKHTYCWKCGQKLDWGDYK